MFNNKDFQGNSLINNKNINLLSLDNTLKTNSGNRTFNLGKKSCDQKDKHKLNLNNQYERLNTFNNRNNSNRQNKSLFDNRHKNINTSNKNNSFNKVNEHQKILINKKKEITLKKASFYNNNLE